MATHSNAGSTIAGTAGGTLLAVFSNLHMDDLVKTTVLAVLGAVVSFTVTLAMKWLIQRMKCK
jgi:hypothetical protein